MFNKGLNTIREVDEETLTSYGLCETIFNNVLNMKQHLKSGQLQYSFNCFLPLQVNYEFLPFGRTDNDPNFGGTTQWYYTNITHRHISFQT